MHRLVVPTDFSEFAQEALRYAVALRRQTGAEVHLLHVASPSETTVNPGEDATREALRHAVEMAEADPREVTCAIRTSYAVGPAAVVYAEEVAADTLVVGTHGRRGFRRLLLGSVAEELVRTSPVDVLVVPQTPISPVPARRLLVPVDLRSGTDGLLAHARGLAEAASPERVDLLHVLEPLPYPVRWLDEAVLDIVPTIRDRAADELRQRAEAAGLAPSGVYVERGDPAAVIARSAEALDSDLVLVAPHAQGRVERTLLGSVASSVARSASRPVLVARSLADPVPAPPEAVRAAA